MERDDMYTKQSSHCIRHNVASRRLSERFMHKPGHLYVLGSFVIRADQPSAGFQLGNL